MCWWCGSFAPGANFISMVARPLSRSTTSVLPSTPAKEVFSHGIDSTSTKREASGGRFAWDAALGVIPLMNASSIDLLRLQVFPDLHDLHGVRAAGLADRLADGEDDEVALLHHVILHQHLLGFAQQLLAVVAD